MAATIYTSVDLIGVLEVQLRPIAFWLETFFTEQFNSEDELIAFDKISPNYRKMAPFVAPNVQGKVMSLEGHTTHSFRPAYVKPKHVVDPDTALMRKPGERLMGRTLSNQQRYDATVAKILADHRQLHTNRQEWLAAQALIYGQVTISGEDYPARTVNFNRNANLTEVLTGTAQWDEPTATSTADPLGDIAEMRSRVKNLGGGVVQDVVFGTAAYANFIRFPEVVELLDKTVKGSDSELSRLSNSFNDSVEFMGTVAGLRGSGLFRIWVYSGTLQADNGSTIQLLQPNDVVGVAKESFRGVRCFGTIKDMDANLRAIEYFPKMWKNEDPSVVYIMTQSAPLMVPMNPDATFRLATA